jgi:hypothetical protein
MANKALTAKARYERRVSDRWVFLDRARQCAELTIPTLIPPDGHTSTTKYYTPWQGIGARGLNNLASKLLLAMFPPNAPFFKLIVDEFTKDKMAGDPNLKSQIDAGFSKMERAVQDEIEAIALRNPMFLVLKHLIAGGNALLHLPAKGGLKFFPLERFVCARDIDGNLLEAIALEMVDEDTLSPEVLALTDEKSEIEDEGKEDQVRCLAQSSGKDDDDIEIYTRWYLDKNRWRSYQEIQR